jgi:hypothetical protein
MLIQINPLWCLLCPLIAVASIFGFPPKRIPWPELFELLLGVIAILAIVALLGTFLIRN